MTTGPVNQSGTKTNTIEATTLVKLNKDQQLQVVKYCTYAQTSLANQYSLRWNMESIDRAYMSETDWTQAQFLARLANKSGDADKLQNITVPIVMTQVQATLGYLTNVFLTGYPIFGVSSDPSNENAAMQMEAIIGENAITAGWAKELMMTFRDGLKYNLCAVECDWQQNNVWTIKTDPSKPNGADPVKTLWQGNVIKRMDLYNTFWDARVHPSEIHSKGEYAGYTELYSRTRFKEYVNSLYNKVDPELVIAALQSQPIQGSIGSSTQAPFGYYQPLLNPYPFFNRTAGFDWMEWAANAASTTTVGLSIANLFSVTIFYARIIPSDFRLSVPAKNTPQVWKFVIVNGQVVLSAERMTNVHNFIPMFFCQPIEDGLDYQTKSFASNVVGMQEASTAMWNAWTASKRRLVGDRVLYDPSRIRSKDINNRNPAAKIPVRPSAYGRPIAESVYAFPFRDEMTESFVQGSTAVINFANMINGQNPAQQGQFVPGNKTLHEYQDVMGHGNSSNQMMALTFEAAMFTPIKQVIKLNILQYQPDAVVYNPNTKQTVNVVPSDIRKESVHFKVSDGLIPTDKITSDDVLQTAIQQLASSPQLAGAFDIGSMVSYLLMTQGLDVSQFKKSPAQLQYEQALQAWSQAAEIAAKNKAPFNTPQPQPSQQLQQEMAAKQQNNVALPPNVGGALESTQG